MAILAQLKDNVVVHRFPLDERTTRVGRLAENDICIDSLEVSGHHAEIRRDGERGYRIEDLGSTNQTFVNEQPVDSAPLRHGDTVRIGWVVFRFLDEQHPDHRKTAKIRKSWIPGVYYTR